MSDLDIIFKEVSKQPEEEQADFFFYFFKDNLSTDTIKELWDYYLEETMQTGISSGISSTIGFSRWHGYSTELEEI
jgi:trehalose/maltose hydrolase-like predicted phosphorylase